MAETTTNETTMTRAEAAVFLRSIADQLDSERGVVSIPVGNKHVELSPPGSVHSKAMVTERSRRFRKDVEELALTFRWSPTGDTVEQGTDESTTEPPREPDLTAGPEAGTASDQDGDEER